MASRDLLGSRTAAAERPWLTPRNLILAGAAVNALATLMAMEFADKYVPARVVLILTGLVLTLVGVNHRLRNFGEELEDRVTTAAYLALASFVTLLAYLASHEDWDTWRLVLGVFVGVGLVGAVLALLPMMLRRGAIVALVLFHFAGILTAVFSVTPPSGVSCWFTGTLWTYVYRPYLEFTYLNNAYHFYSPEPGPATQLWFRVRYQDPNVEPRWILYPQRGDYPSRLSYQRSLAMTESTVQTRYGLPDDFYGPKGRLERRNAARATIPYWSDLPPEKRIFAPPDVAQYREPNDLTSKKYLASYARHVVRDPKYRNPAAPEVAAVAVRVYRVMHSILPATEMAKGTHPEEPSTLLPVYMGEYNDRGYLLDPDDPLLYWVVPILRERDADGEYVIKDYVSVHAGDARSPVTGK